MEAKNKTIYDISEKAGVSIATVSRVLNNSPSVSEKTYKKVKAVMQDLNYQPNVFARGLGTGSMKTIGILCADVADIYLANAVSYLERELRREGFDTILSCTGYDYENKEKCLRDIESRKVDAVIMVGSHYIEKTQSKNKYILEAAKNIPVMMLNGFINGNNVYCLLSDDREAFRNATSFLIGEGRKNIVFLYREATYSQGQKLEGYYQALKDHGISRRDKLVVQCEEKIQNTKNSLISLFEKEKKIDAIIACDDELAVGALKFLKQAGKRVPEDVSLIGCNNSVLSITSEPELTSIDNMCESICLDVVSNLMRVLDGEKTPPRVVVACNLVERGTT